MILSYADALALHGAIITDPTYREGDDPELDLILSRLEAFIGGGRVYPVQTLSYSPIRPGYSVRVPDDAA